LNIKQLVKRSTLMAVALIVVVFGLTSCSGGTTYAITEAGSTTVQPLAQSLADAFMADNPDVTITIQGGGSSVGVQSAADGTVDIGAASRELKPEEETLGLVVYVLAKDGIAIVYHPSQNVTGLTLDQTRQIFSGSITNWSEVGGANAIINVIAREEGSGTRAAFEELVMGDDVITETALLFPSNGALRTAVAGDPNGIGFLSMGYLDETVKAFEIDDVAATIENCVDGDYPIVRPLLFLTKGEPTGKAKDFVDFCLSPAGQAIVAEDWIPVGPTS
jgi:phosphate transport system substrate-binding protein